MKRKYLLLVFIAIVVFGGCGVSSSESEVDILDDKSLKQESVYGEANFDNTQFE